MTFVKVTNRRGVGWGMFHPSLLEFWWLLVGWFSLALNCEPQIHRSNFGGLLLPVINLEAVV
jgi:hypothetical protein